MDNEKYIRLAIEEARKASWPFGAVIVKDDTVISFAGSGDKIDYEHDPTAHAEVNAIRRASEKLQSGNLEGCILYASCEPCALCFGATWYAGIKKIVYGSSLEDITHVNNLWRGDLAFPHDHIQETGIEVVGNISKEEVMEMYKHHPRVLENE